MLTNREINIRDPFVLVHDGKYYLYGSRGGETWGHGTGLDVYVGDDLENWEGPFLAFAPPHGFWSDYQFWAPEVHRVGDGFYMFATFKSETRHRGTQILRADSPMGPFLPITEYPVTPSDWECLDGTLYTDGEGKHSIVFCHEWTQIGDGEICALPLTDDLTAAAGEPVVLFKASSAGWPKTVSEGHACYVTDGPFLYRTSAGRLLLLWSSFTEKGYAEAAAYSEDGTLYGTWRHDPVLLSDRDGGHGMLFTTMNGELTFVMHTPNTSGKERPVFRKVRDLGTSLQLVELSES